MAENWTRVAATKDVPENGVIAVRVGNRAIALYHLPGGEFRATGNICTHEYAQLSDGWLENGQIECPLHAARFDVRTGKVLCAPADKDIPVFEVRVEGADLLVNVPKLTAVPMDFGAAIFTTDYSIAPHTLGVALEERGFESMWATEHSHVPLSRRTPWPGGADLPKWYYDCFDPFVVLTAAAVVTKRLLLGTGICLVIQRDTIQTAKLVASLDQLSTGRFLFGIGGGWNAEEMEDHGTVFATRFKKMREQIEAMKAIWTNAEAEYAGEFVRFPPMAAWPKPARKPHPPVFVGGAFPHAARRAIRYGDGWIPVAGRGTAGIESEIAEFRRMAGEAGRDPASLTVSIFGAAPDEDTLKRLRDLGVARVVTSLPSAGAEQVLPILDRWAGIMRAVNA